METFGIEYNEKQHYFHNTDKYDNYEPAKAQGWVTIFKRISEEHMIMFYDMVDTLYPDRNELNLKQVKRLHKAFIKLINL